MNILGWLDTLKFNRAHLWIFTFCVCYIFFRVFFVPIEDSGRARNSIHGDGFSARKTYSVAMFFKRFGFSKTCFLPYHEYHPENPDDYDPTKVYTHFPPGPQLLTGFTAVVLGTTDSRLLRIVPVLLSLALFFLIFKTLETFLADKQKAFLAACIVLLSNYYLSWADALSEHVYEELARWGIFLLLFLYYQGERKYRSYFVLACLAYFLSVNFSLTVILYLAVLALSLSYAFDRKLISYEVCAFLMCGAAGIALHFFQNVMHFGSIDTAISDLVHSGSGRSTGGATFSFSAYWSQLRHIPLTWLVRIERYFLIPGFAFVPLAFLALRKWKKQSRLMFDIAIGVLLASLTWSLVFTQHFLEHHFTARHLGLFYGLVIATGLVEYSLVFKKAKAKGNRWILAGHSIFIAYILVMAFTQHVLDVYLTTGFLYPLLKSMGSALLL
ncbi:MAG: hypothetical protein HY537_00265 [Deltaproteobacteria bacterium]|nr:hypothetical protein [Deltaproteobacteria bacterium]